MRFCVAARMAKPGLRNHTKFKRLRDILKMPAVYVQAHLQAMWDVGYESGAYLGDSEDVELAAEWEDSGRKRGEWFAAVLATRWLDDLGDGKYGIHDLFDHAPRYVKLRVTRKNKELQEKCAHSGAQKRTMGRTSSPAQHRIQEEGSKEPSPVVTGGGGSGLSKPKNPKRTKDAGQVKGAKPTETTTILGYFAKRFYEVYGTTPNLPPGKSGAHAKWLIGKVNSDSEQAKGILDAFLADADPWLVERRHDFALVRARFDRYSVPIPKNLKANGPDWADPPADFPPDLRKFTFAKDDE